MNVSIGCQPEVTIRRGPYPTIRPWIVVAEDEDEIRHEIVRALSEDGNDVMGVSSGEQLIECLDISLRHSFRPPLLITLDVWMSGRSGLEILGDIRRRGWRTPTVIITAFASDSVWASAELAGAASVLQKPFETTEFRAAAVLARMRPASPPEPDRPGSRKRLG